MLAPNIQVIKHSHFYRRCPTGFSNDKQLLRSPKLHFRGLYQQRYQPLSPAPAGQVPGAFDPGDSADQRDDTPDDFLPAPRSAPSDDTPSQATTSASDLTISSTSRVSSRIRKWLQSIPHQRYPLHHHSRQPSNEDLALVKTLDVANDRIPPLKEQRARLRAKSLERGYKDAQAIVQPPMRKAGYARKAVRWSIGIVAGLLACRWYVVYVVFEADTKYRQKRLAAELRV